MTRPAVSVVLPAHNEAELLGDTLTELTKGLGARGEPYELLVVENGSSDDTRAIAQRAADDDASVRLLTLEAADYGRAVRTGFVEAAAPVAVLFDVDYVDLGFLDEALGLIADGRAGIVLASKRAPGAEDRRPVVRRFLTAGFTAAMRRLLSLPVTDAHGIKAISTERIAPVLEICEMDGPLFDVELVARASKAGISILELPARVEERRPPRTSVLRRSAQSAVGLLVLRRSLRRGSPSRRGAPPPGGGEAPRTT